MIRVYLRASTQDQNAERAKELLSRFVSSDMNGADCVYYIENVSGKIVLLIFTLIAIFIYMKIKIIQG